MNQNQESNHSSKALAAMKPAFVKTLPITTGFLFLAIAYGFYMQRMGFSFWYPTLMAMTIFGGSLEFVTVQMLLSPFAPIQSFLMALMIQARHLFYGISMLERYKNTGWKKFFLIFFMCDETFSLIYTTPVPKGIDKNWYMLWISFFDYASWVLGAALGGLFGSLLSFETKGIDFAMTAMFVVIFVEQFLNDTQHLTAYIGFAAAIICLLVFGPNSFIIPTMLGILAMVTLFRKQIERAGGMTK
jgi:4-azaleucine resistance transporter AzlC